jgi:hypothetical protein
VRKAGLGALLLALLLVARPGLAREPALPPPPAVPAQPATGPAQPTGDEAVPEEEPLPEEEALPEEEPLPEEEVVAVEVEEAELKPLGYMDSTGSLQNLETTDGVRVTVRDRTLRAEHGYTPLEVIVHNSDAVPRPVKVSFRSYGPGAAVISRTLELAPRQRIATYLLIPSALQSGTFTVEGPNLRSRNSTVYMDDPNAISTLVLGSSKALEAGTGVRRADENRTPQVHARFMAPQDAPRELGAYIGYDVVLVTEDAASVPSDVWAALDGYAALGGALILARPPRDVEQRLPLLAAHLPYKAWGAYCFGKVYLCQTGVQECGTELVNAGNENFPPLVAVGPAPRWETSRMALRNGEQPLLPNAMAPVGRFLVLIFLFTVVVGPGGLMLARRKGPAALLIGVPSVALVTCLIIVADSLLGDGFVTHATRYSFTFLDRPRDRAVTSAVGGYYANLASRQVQMPAYGVLMAPDDAEDWTADVNWASGGMQVDGFLPARTYSEWGELAVVPTRARLVVKQEGGGVWVQNALGAPLQSGYVQFDGKLYEVPELADGAETSVSELKGEPMLVENLLQLPLGMKKRARELEDFTRPMRDQEFVAKLGGGGFAPLSSMQVQLHEGVHLVRGQVDAP